MYDDEKKMIIRSKLIGGSCDGMLSVCKPTQYFCFYGVRGILTYPWPYVDFWTSLSPFPLTVVSNPRQRRQLMVSLQYKDLFIYDFIVLPAFFDSYFFSIRDWHRRPASPLPARASRRA